MSHYVIWRDKIFLFGRYEDDMDASPQADEASRLEEAVRGKLPQNELVPFSEIAEALDAVPWDVLIACRRLVKRGIARQGKGKDRGRFGLVQS